ncbi:MAG: alpha/beta hydrolase-fold protein [Planctomycetaceae bacterium]
MSGWRTIEIGGKAADVYEPRSGSAGGADDAAILHLHGHGLATLKDNAPFTAEFEKHGLRVVCPHGARSWWLDRVCAEFDPHVTPRRHLLDAVVPWIAERWGIEPPRIGLTGVSMGGQGALLLAYRHPRTFPVVAAISPAVDFHIWHGRGLPLDEMCATREDARQETATLHLHPLNWPKHQLIVCDPGDEDWFEGIERLASKLRSTGIPFEHDLETRHGGHGWPYFEHMAERVVGFVADRLGRPGG